MMEEYTFREPQELMFSEFSYRWSDQVTDDAGNSTFSGLSFVSNITSTGIAIAASWNRASAGTNLDYGRINVYAPNAQTPARTTGFRVTSQQGHNEFTMTVINPIDSVGAWTVEVLIDDDSSVNAMIAHRVVTVSEGSGGGGGTGDDPRFDAIFGSLANIQDWIIDAEDHFGTLDARVLGLEDNLQILRNDALELGADVALVDKVFGGEIINMQRYANYPQDYSARFNTFYSSVVSNNPDSVSGGAVLAAPLLNNAAYTNATGGGSGNGFLDAIFAFFNGFGIGSTAAIIILAIAAYLILRRGK